MVANVDSNLMPDYDVLLRQLAEYVQAELPLSELTRNTARYCLMDTLGCGIFALRFPECAKHLGPWVKGVEVNHGSRVPGTSLRLDPVKAAWDIGCINRWLDFNDTWLASEWGHPSDNLASILAVMDFRTQRQRLRGEAPGTMLKVLEAMVKAHEIQGILALNHAFNRVGLDHVILVKVASTAVVAWLQGASKQQIMDAISHAWIDGQALRTYRHAPNVVSRKSWAAGDAASRAVRLVDLVLRGEGGCPSALTDPRWGFESLSFGGEKIALERPLGTYVMDHILFKIAYPAEFHAQTAVEAAVALHPEVKERLSEIKSIHLYTQESAIRIISKEGPLRNPADRDHCLQYMVAVGLLFGQLTADYYENHFHEQHLEIDELRSKMYVHEVQEYSEDYLDASKRSIANAIQIEYLSGSKSDKVEVVFPLGHKNRREEAIPLLMQKLAKHLNSRFPKDQVQQLLKAGQNQAYLETMAVDDFCALWTI